MAILGISLNHDASAAITNDNGIVQMAIAEERITRRKNFSGIPNQSISQLLHSCSSVTKVVIGSHNELSPMDAHRMLAPFDRNPSNQLGKWVSPWPGRIQSHRTIRDSEGAKLAIKEKIINLHESLSECEFVWVNHHNSHIGCALGMLQGKKKALLVSLDGGGDHESGAVAAFDGNKLSYLTRIASLDSLGLLYSAVTERYNFTPTKHEGKITGLAAFGDYSEAVDVLQNFLSVNKGKIRIHNTRDLKVLLMGRLLRKVGFRSRIGYSLSEIVDLAEQKTMNYPDLAFAVQKVLEESVLEIVDFYLSKTGLENVSLAGGVFANVKLNQRISEMKKSRDVLVFPNMGDGGIALGGIWSHIQDKGELYGDAINKESSVLLFNDMYLAPSNLYSTEQEILSNKKFHVDSIDSIDDLSQKIAMLLNTGAVVAIHQGAMEFGPRALGNRSIIADPRSRATNNKINARLKRTEFMPFAPVIPLEFFLDYFDIQDGQSLTPFFYMTMTCKVKANAMNLIPAVVHVDGTARPQIVTEKSNVLLHKVLCRWKDLTGIPVLINTSLNVHEHPINMSIGDSILALEQGAFDFLVYQQKIIRLSA